MLGPAIILSAFAAVWAIAGLVLGGQPVWTWVVPAILSAGLVGFVWRRSRDEAPVAPAAAERIGRVTMWASIAEGIGIFVGINLVTWAGRPDLDACVVAAVVGLHFLPMAYLFPRPIYYLTGGALLAVAGAGVLLDPAVGGIVVCLASAVILWGTILARAVQREKAGAPG